MSHTWKRGSIRVARTQAGHSGFVPCPELQRSVLLISRMSVSLDDSSVFVQWAMETVQQDYPPLPAAATYAVLQELRRPELQNGMAPAEVAAQDVHRDSAMSSWSLGAYSGREAGVVVENDGWPWSFKSNYPPVSSHLTFTMAQPTIHDEATTTIPAREPGVPEPAHISPASRKSSWKSAASSSGTGHTSPDQCVRGRGHVMAERKRREKIIRRLIELSAVIPGLKKMDKGTILSDALRYIMEQQVRLKELEGRNAVVLVKRPCIAREPGGTTTTRSSLPELEARISDSNVMVRIHCEDGKGVLVRLLAELEELHLSLTHTNSIPFLACTVNITITAKVDEGFSIAHEDIVGKVEAALRRRNGDH